MDESEEFASPASQQSNFSNMGEWGEEIHLSEILLVKNFMF